MKKQMDKKLRFSLKFFLTKIISNKIVINRGVFNNIQKGFKKVKSEGKILMKKTEKNRNSRVSGITLIALVITIIVLLILADVTN